MQSSVILLKMALRWSPFMDFSTHEIGGVNIPWKCFYLLLASRTVLSCFAASWRFLDLQMALKAREWKTKTASNCPANVCLGCKVGEKQNIFKEHNQLEMSDKNSIIQCKFVQQIAIIYVWPRNLFTILKLFWCLVKKKTIHKDFKNNFQVCWCLPNMIKCTIHEPQVNSLLNVLIFLLKI